MKQQQQNNGSSINHKQENRNNHIWKDETSGFVILL